MIALDIDMPKTCGECPCKYSIGKRNFWCSVERAPYDKNVKRATDYDTRPDWCPLIELEPAETSRGGYLEWEDKRGKMHPFWREVPEA